MIAVLFVIFALSATDALRCWECTPSFSNDACLRKGKLISCARNQDACEDQVRHIFGGTMMLVTKRCKQKKACETNLDQNLRPAAPIQCHVNSPTSICTCCCDREGCNQDFATCWNTYPTYSPARDQECQDFPLQPEHGSVQCQGNKEPGTECSFKCNRGYLMRGKKTVHCMPGGVYDYEPPHCEEKTCPRIKAPGNGSMTCTNDNYLRSRCSFQCDENYALFGPKYVNCHEINPRSRFGRWSSRRVPRCRPLFCMMQGPLYHATVSCTRGVRVDSVCSFTCPTRFEIFPSGIAGRDFSSTRCMPNGEWLTPFPCCHLPCPPFALVDFFIVMDSSPSVQAKNWGRMKDFVLNMLSNFTVRHDAAQYSAFRYTEVADTQTQIFLNSTGNHEEFIEAFRRIPYNGEGTYTGNALNHLRQNVLHVGNRPEASDVVLLITDGRSEDRVAIPARRLRNEGVLLLVLPIQHEDGDTIDLREIRQIAGRGNDRQILTNALENGFDALDDNFARELSAYLCPVPCANPFHGHPDAIPHRLEKYVENHPLYRGQPNDD